MAARASWSGFLQISLVSVGVKIYPASTPGRQVQFHEIDRRTHRRVHHRNVDTRGEVDRADIVKGYEYARGKFIEIDPKELRSLRMATATAVEIQQFVKADELPLELLEKPYFVAPKDKTQAKALAIMSRALTETATFGVGRSLSAAENIWRPSRHRRRRNRRV